MTVSAKVLTPAFRGRGVTAVLGPTNTGKTHLAIERMLAQPSGIIGLPLRLLAREVYNRIVERVGADAVALVTGEEKIKPVGARYWVATIEAMPLDLDVDFVAIDEVQIAADLERGHVFTDRILNRRGRYETLLLGSATIRPMIERLIPGANVVTRPRMSMLTSAGEKKLTRLPTKSAIVAFSADEVYAIAELVKRQRGGAAVVLGALSPRTRNAQVELYQNGDVDYLIATDAIGMGLNLDVDHVAFAGDRKYDGFQFRRLNPSELGQIAGRAGRHLRNGTFGTTGRCPGFEPELIERLESHEFEPIKLLQWRNTDLDYASLAALQESLAVAPSEPGLTRAPIGEDIEALEQAARDPEIRRLAQGESAVARLWEVCQVPDYRKVAPAVHAELVTTLYGFLASEGTIPTDWFAQQVKTGERTDGDIDTLSARIAHIRTWTFVANRPDWLKDPEHWQNVTRNVEDRLSDALHERLTQRFVDRRTSVLMRRLREKDMLEAEVTASGEVLVEGQHVGRLAAFQFTPDAGASDGPETKALRAAAQKALAGEFEARAEKLAAAPDADIVLSNDGALRWLGEPVGRLIAGDKPLAPQVRLLADDTLSPAGREKAEGRLLTWISQRVERLLGPLSALEKAEDVTGMARGVAYQLVEALGVLDRARVSDEVKGLEQDARAALRRHGVRFGAYHIYMPNLLKPAPRTLAAQLWALSQSGEVKGLDEVPALAASGRTSFKIDPDVPKALYRLVGYRVCGDRAVRVDILERLADLIRPALSYRPVLGNTDVPPGAVDGHGFTVTVAMTSLVGCSGEDFASILKSLGYRMERRPAPAKPVAEAAQAEPQAAEDAVASAEAGTAEASSEHLADSISDTPIDDADVEDAAAAPSETPSSETRDVPHEGAAAVDISLDAGSEHLADAISESAACEEPRTDETLDAAEEPEEAVSAEPAAEAAAAEPEFIEVWRPGRQHSGRPPRREGEGRRGGGPRDGQRGRGADRRGEGSKDRAAGEQAADGNKRPDKDGRTRHGKGGKGGKPGGGNANANAGGQNRGNAGGFRQRPERPADPNSPFAALADLKAQLEQGKSGRR